MKLTILTVSFFTGLFFILLTSCNYQTRQQQLILPKQVGYVNDFDSLFSVKEKAALESMLIAFESRSNIQIVIATFNRGFSGPENVDDFTLRIGNTWEVGQKSKHKGIVIGICAECRSIRIQNGYAIEKILSDHETKKIIDSFFIPQFQTLEYFEGTYLGSKHLISTLEAKLKIKDKAN